MGSSKSKKIKGTRAGDSNSGIENTDLSQKLDTNQTKPIKKKQPDPLVLIQIAIILFFIDYIIFQKPLPNFLIWLLLITPLMLLALSFFIWAKRKQFPWLITPFDLFPLNNTSPEWNNVFHAVLVCLLFLSLAVFITYLFLISK